MARRRSIVRTQASTRAQACAEFARKKTRERRRMWCKRALLALTLMAVAGITTQDMWTPKVPSVVRVADRLNNRFWGMSASAGFALQQTYLYKRRYAARSDVENALSLRLGAPILSLDLAMMKDRLEAIPEVKNAHLHRVLPNALHVVLDERVPVARWQYQGKRRLIDDEGVVLKAERYAHRMQLPVVVGEAVPKKIGKLLEVLRAEPLLYTNVAAAIDVGSRRWNIRLNNGVTVMLPEDTPKHAWHRFAQLVRDDAILTRAIDTIDLRMEDRVFITPVAGATALPVTFHVPEGKET